jgi:hypothetical protein
VPAHIAGDRNRHSINQNAHANMRASFARIGIKGRMWWLKYRGESEVMKASAGTDHQGRPLPEAPIQHLDVIVVGIAAALQKTYYKAGWTEGNTNPPDCFSVDGVTPDRASTAIQAAACAGCPMNAWGSGPTTPNGKKSRACKDARRIVVVPDGDVENESNGGPMLLQVPAASLSNLDRYVRELDKHGAEINAVRTRLTFNPQVSHPEIVFATTGWIEDADDYQAVQDMGRSSLVRDILEEAPPEGIGPVVEGEVATALASRPAHMTAAGATPEVLSARAVQQQAMQAAWEAKQRAEAQEAAAPTEAPKPVQQAAKPAPRVAPVIPKVAQAPRSMEAAIHGAPAATIESSIIESIDDVLGA